MAAETVYLLTSLLLASPPLASSSPGGQVTPSQAAGGHLGRGGDPANPKAFLDSVPGRTILETSSEEPSDMPAKAVGDSTSAQTSEKSNDDMSTNTLGDGTFAQTSEKPSDAKTLGDDKNRTGNEDTEAEKREQEEEEQLGAQQMDWRDHSLDLTPAQNDTPQDPEQGREGEERREATSHLVPSHPHYSDFHPPPDDEDDVDDDDDDVSSSGYPVSRFRSSEEKHAVQRGVKAQLELCDAFCSGTSDTPLRKNPNRCAVPMCVACSCDNVCHLYGDCCPRLQQATGQATGTREYQQGDSERAGQAEKEGTGPTDSDVEGKAETEREEQDDEAEEEREQETEEEREQETEDEREELKRQTEADTEQQEEEMRWQTEAPLPNVGNWPVLCLPFSVGCGTSYHLVIAGCPDPASPHASACRLCGVQGGGGPQASPRPLVLSLTTSALYCSVQCALCHNDTVVTAVPYAPCPFAGLDLKHLRDTGHHRGHRQDTYQYHRPSSPSAAKTFPPPFTMRDLEGHSLPTCPLVQPPMQSVLRTCHSPSTTPAQPVSTCDSFPSSDMTRELCRRYSYPVRAFGTLYRNLFCALCNGVLLNMNVSCGRQLHVDMRRIDSDWPDLTMLTNLQRPIYSTPPVLPQRCATGQWYDPVKDTCRPLVCQDFRQLMAPFCVDTPNTSSKVTLYMLNLLFSPLASATHLRCFENLPFIQSEVVPYISRAMADLGCRIFSLLVVGGREWGSFTVSVRLLVPRTANQTQFELRLTDVLVKDRVLLKNVGENTSVEFRTTITPFQFWTQVTFLSFFNGSCCYVAKAGFNLYSYFYNVAAYRFLVPARDLREVRFDPLLPHAQVRLTQKELQLSEDGVYRLTDNNASLPAWQVKKENKDYFVPASFLHEAYRRARILPEPTPVADPQREVRSWSVLGALTTACLAVSVFSLLVLLTTYAALPTLRTLPACNTAFLAVWLLLAQTLLLAVPPRVTPDVLCRALGVCLHYAWLCVLAWSSVCSFHMFHVFVAQRDRAMAPHRPSWYYWRYVPLAHGVPALIVLLVFIIRGAASGGRDVGYGEGGEGGRVCYLNSRLLVGLAFALPLAMSVVFNLFSLLFTARTLSRVQRVKRYGLNADREAGNVAIYVRLSSLTGLCWLLALLAEIPGCQWLHYVSVVVNGLQGFHLAVSYAGNRRVLKLWRERLTGVRVGRRNAQSSMSTASSSLPPLSPLPLPGDHTTTTTTTTNTTNTNTNTTTMSTASSSLSPLRPLPLPGNHITTTTSSA